MDRIWQWAWDRHSARYSWVIWAGGVLVMLPSHLMLSFVVLAFEGSDRYLPVAGLTVVTVLALAYVLLRPGKGGMRLIERWAGGCQVDRLRVLTATYTDGRGMVSRLVASQAVFAALLLTVVGAIAGAPAVRLAQYALVGAVTEVAVLLIAVHTFVEAALRPARTALDGDTGIGDHLPSSRPTFATWANISVLAVAFAFTVGGAILAAVIGRIPEIPLLTVVIGLVMTVGFAVPFTVGANFAPSLQPLRDLAEGTERVAAGDYSRRLPVVQDDDLGALAASFNRMQAGLAERRRLHAAFGTYVDPSLAVRLLEQGDDVFTGDRREVTVMFIDIRDFTPYAETHTAEDTVARLNALFDIVVPAVVEVGGHVNKFLGDGALAVFGAPNDLPDHAAAAIKSSLVIDHLVAERFGTDLRIGIGINTGVVIAGTLGGGGKLEFTLIGDAVNVAARVEQLTKTTGDTILLTRHCVDALATRPAGLIDRGLHALKGKASAVRIFGLHPEAEMRSHPTPVTAPASAGDPTA